MRQLSQAMSGLLRPWLLKAEPDIVFIHASDPQMDWNNCNGPAALIMLNWGVTIDKINQLNPDFVLVTGDLVNSSTSDCSGGNI